MEQETEATEERIERYTKQQTAMLKMFGEKARQDYEDIISVLDDAPCDLNITDGTNDALASAKLLSDLTPPVTPDSTPMSIGNSPNFKHQSSFLLNARNTIGSNAKSVANFNHSTPDKAYQMTNASDDIFFDMDGLGNEINPQNNQRNNFDSDDDNEDNDDRDLGK